MKNTRIKNYGIIFISKNDFKAFLKNTTEIIWQKLFGNKLKSFIEAENLNSCKTKVFP